MAKLTNIRERVQQPYRDSLVRTAGTKALTISDNTDLFRSGQSGGTFSKGIGETNLSNGNTLSSDASMIVLALRVFQSHRPSRVRTYNNAGLITKNGEFETFANATGEPAAGNAIGDAFDQYRLYDGVNSSVFWSFGVGGKLSITSMPSSYFPYGGGLWGALGNTSEFVHMNNGDPSQAAILKLARAILLTPRQEILCQANCQVLPAGGNEGVFGTSQGSRNMLSIAANLGACDGIQKVVTFTFDGLLSRDVQLSCQ